jgi:hypothetical protein
VRAIFWTRRARGDLASIRSFIEQESPYFADVVIGRLFIATDRLAQRCDLITFFLGDLVILHQLFPMLGSLRKSEVFQVTPSFSARVALTL